MVPQNHARRSLGFSCGVSFVFLRPQTNNQSQLLTIPLVSTSEKTKCIPTLSYCGHAISDTKSVNFDTDHLPVQRTARAPSHVERATRPTTAGAAQAEVIDERTNRRTNHSNIPSAIQQTNKPWASLAAVEADASVFSNNAPALSNRSRPTYAMLDASPEGLCQRPYRQLGCVERDFGEEIYRRNPKREGVTVA